MYVGCWNGEALDRKNQKKWQHFAFFVQFCLVALSWVEHRVMQFMWNLRRRCMYIIVISDNCNARHHPVHLISTRKALSLFIFIVVG